MTVVRLRLLGTALAVLTIRAFRGAWRALDESARAVAWVLLTALVFLLSLTMGAVVGGLVTGASPLIPFEVWTSSVTR